MYDLVLRDATVVSSKGRQVTDVAILNGKIAVVGIVPRKKGKEEISAIGRFLMPGVIDTGAQLDPASDPAGWERETAAAITGGITTLLALPGGDSPVIDKNSAKKRVKRAAGKSWCHFGLWGMAKADNATELLAAADQGLIQGILAYAGGTDARTVGASTLDQFCRGSGVLGVQLDGGAEELANLGPTLVRLARERGGPVHLMHLSTAEELALLDPVRGDLPMTAGVTPHHLFFAEETLGGLAERMVTRPKVRPEQERRSLWTAIKRGRVDCIASDHHFTPHATERGVPSAELMFPLLLSAVKFGRLSLELLVALCAESPAKLFGLPNKGKVVVGADADLILFSESDGMKVDSAAMASSAGWTPYADRDIAAKPELVLSGGRVVARKGKLTGDEPRGQFVGAA